MTDTQPSGAESALDLEKLLPCPFCGSANIDPAGWSGIDEKGGPGCGNCGALADSAELWNRRATAPHAGPGPAEIRNITQIERSSDQSVRVTFTSARAASAFSASLAHTQAALSAHPTHPAEPVCTVCEDAPAEIGGACALCHWKTPVGPGGGALVAMSEWEAGREDADGNLLVTRRADELVAAADFMTQGALASVRIDGRVVRREELAERFRSFSEVATPTGALVAKADFDREEFMRQVLESACEIPDRNSPEDQPEMLLLTTEELENIMRSAFELIDEEAELADESAAAPAEVIADRQYLDGFDAGFMAGEAGDHEKRASVHAARRAGIREALTTHQPSTKGEKS
jgi:hypothetical protein